ncbi:unnamed protein product [Gongylonema pulchrum]|uniref:Uncharacterized protein n=1 Tax=Gongylonema pulchrum TaxID=637853 RepID=A0A3P7NAM0_9BILA|nr:unnamed protein product [Gongylonema pulchrum]
MRRQKKVATRSPTTAKPLKGNETPQAQNGNAAGKEIEKHPTEEGQAEKEIEVPAEAEHANEEYEKCRTPSPLPRELFFKLFEPPNRQKNFGCAPVKEARRSLAERNVKLPEIRSARRTV